jgi:parallel beta-helix repeat protein
MIEKSLTLRGQGAGRTTLASGDDVREVVRVECYEDDASIVIEHLSLVGDGKMPERCGVLIRGAQRSVTIESCSILKHSAVGIYVAAYSGPTQVTISNCRVFWNDCGGISISGPDARATISGCYIFHNSSYGLDLFHSEATVTGCTLFGNGSGILTMAKKATISDSSIRGNYGDGIDARGWAAGDAELTVTGCDISRNSGSGISLGGSLRATIEGNTIDGNRTFGISLYDHLCRIFCLSQDVCFTGVVTGKENTVRGAVCPQELEFLATPQGGELKWPE